MDEYYDDDYEPTPKVFKCSFRVIGSDSKNKSHVIIEERNFCMVALDAQDAIDKIEKDHINIEFNQRYEGNIYHAVSTKVDVYSVRSLGPLMTITDKCLNIIAEDCKRPEIKPDDDN
jgi:hypothetical protein